MMSTIRFRTNFLLWAAASWCVFIVFGFVDPMAGVGKGDNTLWAAVARFTSGANSCSTSDILVVIFLMAIVQAAPAILIGWVIQAAFVVIEWRFRLRPVKQVVARPVGDKLVP
jgi:hypothetical protein